MLVVVMSGQSLYQLGVITYFQVNRSFIAEFLCINREKPMSSCQGQCFLMKKLSLANEAKKDKANVPAAKERLEFPFFLISKSSYSFSDAMALVSNNSRYLLMISSEHSSAPFHPPTLV
jgi:hypothetical protein